MSIIDLDLDHQINQSHPTLFPKTALFHTPN